MRGNLLRGLAPRRSCNQFRDIPLQFTLATGWNGYLPSRKDRAIPAARNLQNPYFIRAIRREVAFQPLPELCGVHPDDVVLAGVVMRGTSENRGANLLLVKLRFPQLDRLLPYIEEKLPKPGSPSKLRAPRDAVQQRQSFLCFSLGWIDLWFYQAHK
jgi:hypothetical protein